MNGEATTTKSMGRFGERSGRFVNTLDLVDLRSGGLHIETDAADAAGTFLPQSV
ncbi:MAG: hypothetical protein ABSB70_25425 [Candidatus Velthaea sp.]|jgi:hypothetical protein